MSACERCGSWAINHRYHGRDGSDPELCDVCFWRKRAEGTATKFADKFKSDLDNYIAAHKLEWSEADEAVRNTLEFVIKELRGAA